MCEFVTAVVRVGGGSGAGPTLHAVRLRVCALGGREGGGPSRAAVTRADWTHITTHSPGPLQQGAPNRPLARCLYCGPLPALLPRSRPGPAGPAGARPALLLFAHMTDDSPPGRPMGAGAAGP